MGLRRGSFAIVQFVASLERKMSCEQYGVCADYFTSLKPGEKTLHTRIKRKMLENNGNGPDQHQTAPTSTYYCIGQQKSSNEGPGREPFTR